jgi:hypothetical protein
MDVLYSLVAALGIGILQVRLWAYRVGDPDPRAGDWEEYQRAASGNAPRPFCWRWLVPALARSSPAAWRAITVWSLALLPAALVFFLHTHRVGGPLSWTLTALALTLLPVIYERGLKILHLVDAPALLLALLTAACSRLESPGVYCTLPLAILTGATRETAPIFAALWAMNPLPLIGLLGVPFWRRGVAPWRHSHLYEQPWRRHMNARWQQGFHLGYLVGWGAFLPAWPHALGTYPWILMMTLTMATIPILRSIDVFRLLVPWCVPILALSLCQITPGALAASCLLGLLLSSQWQA